jgi:predicted GH43/DUF377 family glycosyl hydrolase
MNIQQLRNIFSDQQIARFNLAAWQKPNSDSVFFIGREVTEPGTLGEPDTGILKLFELDAHNEIIHERLIWKPMYEGINLEDPRALQLDEEQLVIGLTAVLRDKKGVPIPFPAIIKIDSHSSWLQELPPFLVIGSFGPGKNLTPIDNTTYLFRPDALEYHHKILVFSIQSQVPQKLCDISFPTTLSWAKWRIGTTMPPIWINEHEALFIIHGITIEKIGEKDKYVYSLGRAKLTRRDGMYSVIVAPEPILIPDHFMKADGEPLVNELHPELRRVVYSCGGVIKRNKSDTLSLYVNVGDRTTFEVELSLEELKKGLF